MNKLCEKSGQFLYQLLLTLSIVSTQPLDLERKTKSTSWINGKFINGKFLTKSLCSLIDHFILMEYEVFPMNDHLPITRWLSVAHCCENSFHFNYARSSRNPKFLARLMSGISYSLIRHLYRFF